MNIINNKLPKINIKNLSFEEKLKLLPENDKLYLSGYIDKALNTYINKAKQYFK